MISKSVKFNGLNMSNSQPNLAAKRMHGLVGRSWLDMWLGFSIKWFIIIIFIFNETDILRR